MNEELSAFSEDIKRHFDTTAEALRSDVRTVAEGVLTVQRDLEASRLESRAGFAETQAMIKFSHAELDRRVTALEDRVSRIEAQLAQP